MRPDTVASYLGYSRLSSTMLEWTKNRKKCRNSTFPYGKWQYYLHSSESSSMYCPIFCVCAVVWECLQSTLIKYMLRIVLLLNSVLDCFLCSLPGKFPRLYSNFMLPAQNIRATNYGSFSGHHRNRQSHAHLAVLFHTVSWHKILTAAPWVLGKSPAFFAGT